MSNTAKGNGLASMAGMIGKQGFATVNPSGKGAPWRVAVTVRDVRQAFGRSDFLVEPAAPNKGPSAWIESIRFGEGIG